MDSLRSHGFFFSFLFLFGLQGKLFSHVNIFIATINWVNIVVHSPFRSVGMQPVINIQKGNRILKKKKVGEFFHVAEWSLIGLLVSFQQ